MASWTWPINNWTRFEFCFILSNFYKLSTNSSISCPIVGELRTRDFFVEGVKSSFFTCFSTLSLFLYPLFYGLTPPVFITLNVLLIFHLTKLYKTHPCNDLGQLLKTLWIQRQLQDFPQLAGLTDRLSLSNELPWDMISADVIPFLLSCFPPVFSVSWLWIWMARFGSGSAWRKNKIPKIKSIKINL